MKKVFDKSYSILEYEVDPAWQKYTSKDYRGYRKKWERASRQYLYKFPLCIEIESSYYCNLKCPVCARQVLGFSKERGFISRKLYKKILAEAKKHKMPAIMLDHEAEPLTNPAIADLVKEAKDAGILDIWMHTNANLLKEEIADKLIRNGLTKINFSIDATDEKTYDIVRPGGNFERVIKNILAFLRLKEELKAKYIRTRVSFVVQDINRNEQDTFFKFWKDRVNVISFQNLIDFSKFKKLSGNKRNYRKGFICNKSWQMMIIRHNGDVVPCGMPLRSYDSKECVIGNLNLNSIEECWNSPQLNRIREFQKRGDYHKVSFCRDCLFAYADIKE